MWHFSLANDPALAATRPIEVNDIEKHLMAHTAGKESSCGRNI